MSEKKEKPGREVEEFSDLFDPTYQGNIFGWKISFIGLGVILFFIGLIVYRHITMDVSFTGHEIPQETIDSMDMMIRDTLN